MTFWNITYHIETTILLYIVTSMYSVPGIGSWGFTCIKPEEMSITMRYFGM